jgi:hypothetical protein
MTPEEGLKALNARAKVLDAKYMTQDKLRSAIHTAHINCLKCFGNNGKYDPKVEHPKLVVKKDRVHIHSDEETTDEETSSSSSSSDDIGPNVPPQQDPSGPDQSGLDPEGFPQPVAAMYNILIKQYHLPACVPLAMMMTADLYRNQSDSFFPQNLKWILKGYISIPSVIPHLMTLGALTHFMMTGFLTSIAGIWSFVTRGLYGQQHPPLVANDLLALPKMEVRLVTYAQHPYVQPHKKLRAKVPIIDTVMEYEPQISVKFKHLAIPLPSFFLPSIYKTSIFEAKHFLVSMNLFTMCMIPRTSNVSLSEMTLNSRIDNILSGENDAPVPRDYQCFQNHDVVSETGIVVKLINERNRLNLRDFYEPPAQPGYFNTATEYMKSICPNSVSLNQASIFYVLLLFVLAVQTGTLLKEGTILSLSDVLCVALSAFTSLGSSFLTLISEILSRFLMES